MGADDFRFFHFNAEVLPDKVHRREDRQIGIPLAAARTADLRNGIQRPGGHPVGKGKGFDRQRSGPGDDGDEHARADSGSAGAPETAGPARDVFSSAQHFRQSLFEHNLSARPGIGGQQRGTDQHMMFRTMHMTEGQGHQMFQDFDWISGGFLQALTDHGIHSGGMACIADIVAMDASGFAELFSVAQRAFHEHIRREIFKLRMADQAFFIHESLLFISGIRQTHRGHGLQWF